jgi:hypothetical protein
MRVLFYILMLSVIATYAQSQDAEISTEQIIKDEAWILRPKEPTKEERLRKENTRWMLETSARHWSGKGEMTSEELDKLRSIYLHEEGKQKVDAFSIITFVEEVENWESDLVQMLYSNEQAYVQSALNVFSAKMQKGSRHEKSVLANNAAIASGIEDLESLWGENANIQNKVQQSKLGLENFQLTDSRSAEPVAEILPPAPEVVEELTSPEPSIEAPAEVAAPEEPSEESLAKSSNWWLWLIGLLVVIGGLGLVLRRKD